MIGKPHLQGGLRDRHAGHKEALCLLDPDLELVGVHGQADVTPKLAHEVERTHTYSRRQDRDRQRLGVHPFYHLAHAPYLAEGWRGMRVGTGATLTVPLNQGCQPLQEDVLARKQGLATGDRQVRAGKETVNSGVLDHRGRELRGSAGTAPPCSPPAFCQQANRDVERTIP